MEGYATHDYYAQEYGGTAVARGEFGRLAVLASRYMDERTRGRIREATEDVKCCCCAVAELMAEQESVGGLLSASNDGYSETYAAGGGDYAPRMEATLRMFLGNTDMLNSWV